MKIVVSHGGWPWVHQMLHIAFRRPNVYLSPDQYLAQMRFKAAASVELGDHRRAIKEIADAVAAGFVAVNIEPGAQPVPIETDDRKLYPVYGYCEDHDIPVIVLAGGNAGPDIGYTMPVALDRMLGDFPG